MIRRIVQSALAAAGPLTLASAAFAAEPVVARLQQPLSTDARIIAGGAMFVCHEDRCVATAPGSRTLALSACRDLAKAAGAVESFGDGRKNLAEEKIGQCNAAAPAGVGDVGKR